VSVAKTKVQYPAQFSLQSTEELASAIIEFQAIMSAANGEMLETEGELYTALLKLMLPGLDDETYSVMDKEIRDYLQEKADQAEAASEMGGLNGMLNGAVNGVPPNGAPVDAAPVEPTAQVIAKPEKGMSMESVSIKPKASG
jgi:hypothetical protein